QLVELNPVPWNVSLDRADIVRRCPVRSLVAIFGAVYDIMAEAKGAQTWCCKSLANIQYLDAIEDYFRDGARYIYLYRDGRDVAVSFRKAVVGEKHFYHIAKEWGDTQRLALDFRGRIDPARVFSIRYEDITGQPETTMRALCKFLGYRYVPSMLNFHKTDEAQKAAKSSDLWGNVTNPVMADNTRKFLREASHEDLVIFERVAGDVLTALGYERAATRPGESGGYSAEDVRRFAVENQQLKQEVLSKVDPEDMKRRDRQAGLIQQIRQRTPVVLSARWHA
ncbi:MAG: sulfotransferase, partial [Gammaproteobacteria bacterium]|nr:sulfotransferase [Gammaproteobacteria bacterium]